MAVARDEVHGRFIEFPIAKPTARAGWLVKHTLVEQAAQLLDALRTEQGNAVYDEDDARLMRVTRAKMAAQARLDRRKSMYPTLTAQGPLFLFRWQGWE